MGEGGSIKPSIADVVNSEDKVKILTVATEKGWVI